MNTPMHHGPIRPLTDAEAIALYDRALPGFLDDTDDEQRAEAAEDVRAIVAADGEATAIETVWYRLRLCADYEVDRDVARTICRGARKLGAWLPGDRKATEVEQARLDEHNALWASA